MTTIMEIAPNVNKSREVDFKQLYESSFPAVAGFVRKMNGSLEDATDIFHDALVIYYEKIRERNLIIQTSEEAYILGIAKHLWIRKFNRDRSQVSFDGIEHLIEIPTDYFPSVNTNRLLEFLETVGKACLNLLRSFYFEEKPLAEIAQSFSYRNEHSVAVQKYKCIEKLREAAKQKPALYENLFE
jgi:RNA polymerase sigma factor (sigma-70 family)